MIPRVAFPFANASIQALSTLAQTSEDVHFAAGSAVQRAALHGSGEIGHARPVSDAQVRKLMEEMSKHGHIGRAAMNADMGRKTARKYVASGKFPSEMTARRDWRTRIDPFGAQLPEIEERLRLAPELEARTLFDLLQDQHPERYQDGQLRALHHRVKWWRAARPEQGSRRRAAARRSTNSTSRVRGSAARVECDRCS